MHMWVCTVQKQVDGVDYKSVFMVENKWQIRVIFDRNDYDEQCHKNNLFGNPKVITDRQKAEIPVNFLTNSGFKIVGDISGSIQTTFYTDMIYKVISLNEITKNTE